MSHIEKLDRMNSDNDLSWFLDHQCHDVDSLHYQTSCPGTVALSETVSGEIPEFERCSFWREIWHCGWVQFVRRHWGLDGQTRQRFLCSCYIFKD